MADRRDHMELVTPKATLLRSPTPGPTRQYSGVTVARGGSKNQQCRGNRIVLLRLVTREAQNNVAGDGQTRLVLCSSEKNGVQEEKK